MCDTLCRNAGGRTSELTSELVKTCQSLIGVETCMHLTCTNMPAEKVDTALRVRKTFHSVGPRALLLSCEKGRRR
jgi:5,10-methylenetetrahydrofolate reductase